MQAIPAGKRADRPLFLEDFTVGERIDSGEWHGHARYDPLVRCDL